MSYEATDIPQEVLDLLSEISDQPRSSAGTSETEANSKSLSAQQIEDLYGIAYNLYNTGRVKDAIELFRFLCQLDATQSRHWMGFAASLQLETHYDQAIAAYFMAFTLDAAQDPTPMMHIGDCLLSLGKKEEAMHAYQFTQELASKDDAYDKLRTRAEALVTLIAAQVSE